MKTGILCALITLMAAVGCRQRERPKIIGHDELSDELATPVGDLDVVGIWEGQAEVGVGYVCLSLVSNHTAVLVWPVDAMGGTVWAADWQLTSNILTCVTRGIGGGTWRGKVILGGSYGDNRTPTFSRMRHCWSPGGRWFNVWRKEDLDFTRQTAARLLEEAKSRATTGPDQEGKGIQSGRITTSRQETSGL